MRLRLSGILCIIFLISTASNARAQDAEYAPSNTAPDVETVMLDHSVVYLKCSAGLSGPAECSDSKAQFVEVKTTVSDKENNPVIITYEVTAGRIVGQGQKVYWHLDGAKPGVHTITAIADDGGGPKGRRVTKEVEVKECENCTPK